MKTCHIIMPKIKDKHTIPVYFIWSFFLSHSFFSNHAAWRPYGWWINIPTYFLHASSPEKCHFHPLLLRGLPSLVRIVSSLNTYFYSFWVKRRKLNATSFSESILAALLSFRGNSPLTSDGSPLPEHNPYERLTKSILLMRKW